MDDTQRRAIAELVADARRANESYTRESVDLPVSRIRGEHIERALAALLSEVGRLDGAMLQQATAFEAHQRELSDRLLERGRQVASRDEEIARLKAELRYDEGCADQRPDDGAVTL